MSVNRFQNLLLKVHPAHTADMGCGASRVGPNPARQAGLTERAREAADLTEPLVEVCSSQSQRHTHRAGSDTDGQKTQGACLLAHVDGVALAAGTATYLDVIHIAIV